MADDDEELMKILEELKIMEKQSKTEDDDLMKILEELNAADGSDIGTDDEEKLTSSNDELSEILLPEVINEPKPPPVTTQLSVKATDEPPKAIPVTIKEIPAVVKPIVPTRPPPRTVVAAIDEPPAAFVIPVDELPKMVAKPVVEPPRPAVMETVETIKQEPVSDPPLNVPEAAPAKPEPDEKEIEKKLEQFFDVPPPTKNLLEALLQRLGKYKSISEEAQAEGNSSKARRIGRIVKQYETAVKAHKSRKDFDYDSLPNLIGWPDLPVPRAAAAPAAPVQPSQRQAGASLPRPTQPAAPQVSPQRQPAGSLPRPKQPAPQAPTHATVPRTARTAGGATRAAGGTARTATGTAGRRTEAASKSTAAPRVHRQSSVHSKQLSYLLERQELFKEAALDAKKKGNIDKAKDYLRQCKGFNPLIEATRSGLPIDASSIPTPPQLRGTNQRPDLVFPPQRRKRDKKEP
ncbi:Coiled-coil and C2 domain-containing protein 1-like [Halotydeus destructor]|nr:Coiled-coil and C2 domain-containing protein 1-like [Halotydeus destructor]